MVTICRHIKTNGQRCGSPALKDNYFCYYHDKIHNVGAEPHLKYGPLQLPAPEDLASVQLSVARINDVVIHGVIDLKKATTLLYGLQIAAQYINRAQKFDESKTVLSAELTVQGDELAPDESINNSDGDGDQCSCGNRGQCATQNGSKTSPNTAPREKVDCETVRPTFPNEINNLEEKISQSHSFCEPVRLGHKPDALSGKSAACLELTPET